MVSQAKKLDFFCGIWCHYCVNMQWLGICLWHLAPTHETTNSAKSKAKRKMRRFFWMNDFMYSSEWSWSFECEQRHGNNRGNYFQNPNVFALRIFYALENERMYVASGEFQTNHSTPNPLIVLSVEKPVRFGSETFKSKQIFSIHLFAMRRQLDEIKIFVRNWNCPRYKFPRIAIVSGSLNAINTTQIQFDKSTLNPGYDNDT